MKASIILSFLIHFLFVLLSNAQEPGLFEFTEFRQAVDKGTRTREGIPGDRYWQNTSDYRIEATLDTAGNTLAGFAVIKYHNNSPDSLRVILFRIYQELYKKGGARMEPMAEAITHNGVIIDSLKVNGTLYIKNNVPVDSRKITRYGTLLLTRLNGLIQKNSTAEVEIAWKFAIPDGLRSSLDRMGRYRNAVFMGLWYPQIAVYDDIEGWDGVPHLGTLEFYNDFNNYDVVLNVPDGYMVWATGECINPHEVLNDRIIQRLELARSTDTIIHIINRDDYPQGVVKGNRWHFRADHVPDFAFAAASDYLWQGTSVITDRQSGRRVFLDIAAPNDSLNNFNSMNVFRSAIRWASDSFPGVPFPYEHSTIFLNGSRNKGSMEYPMMVNNSSYLFKALHNAVIVHESYHCYFPFYMGFNETRYMWMDEGFTNFNEHKFTGDGISLQVADASSYTQSAGRSLDYPLMFFKAEETSGLFSYMVYVKPCNNLILLEILLGKERFAEATRQFMKDWNGKHPTPYDMFYSYSRFTPEDISWFWKACYFDPGYADLAIKDVGKKMVVIERKGTVPVPVYLDVTYDDGSKETAFANLAIWKSGLTEYTIKLKSSRTIRTVKLGNIVTPDADPSDNNYPPK